MNDYINIKFQSGPVKDVGVNGCQIEDVIDVLVERLRSFQRGPLACNENSQAIQALLGAKTWLLHRTMARREQGVEGTMEPHKS